MVYKYDILAGKRKLAKFSYLRKLWGRIEGYQKNVDEIAQLNLPPYLFKAREHIDLLVGCRHEWLLEDETAKSVTVGGFATSGAIIYLYPDGKKLIMHAASQDLPILPFSSLVGRTLDLDSIDKSQVIAILSCAKPLSYYPQMEENIATLLVEGLDERNIFLFSNVPNFGVDSAGHVGEMGLTPGRWLDMQLQWLVLRFMMRAMIETENQVAPGSKKKGIFSRIKRSPHDILKSKVLDLGQQLSAQYNVKAVLKHFLSANSGDKLGEKLCANFLQMMLATLPTLFEEKVKVSGDANQVLFTLLVKLEQQLGSKALSFGAMVKKVEQPSTVT